MNCVILILILVMYILFKYDNIMIILFFIYKVYIYKDMYVFGYFIIFIVLMVLCY